MKPVDQFLETLRQTLEEIERDLLVEAEGEKVGGNVVKHAHYQGEALGIRMTIDALNQLALKYFVMQPHPMTKEYLQEAARAVEAKLPDNHGFLLLTAPYGEGDGRLNYASTMKREDAIHLLKEFLLKAGAAEDWMKHIK